MSVKDKFVELFETTEMREYMNEKFDDLSSRDIAAAVYRARINLQKKLKLFEEFKILYPEVEQYEKYTELFRRAINNMETRAGDIFIILICECHPKKSSCPTKDFCAAFSDYDDAIHYIKNYYREEYLDDSQQDETTANLLCWFIVEKWCKNEEGKLEKSICFDVMGTGEVIRFHGDNLVKKPEYFPFDKLPNLPVPFKVGDIVTLDCRPYLPKRLGVILEIGDNRGCCSRQCLYINRKGRIDVGTLIHNSTFFDFHYWESAMSPLYRIEKFQGKIKEKDCILKMVSDYINENEELGSGLWNFVADSPYHYKEGLPKKFLKSELLNKLLYPSTSK